MVRIRFLAHRIRWLKSFDYRAKSLSCVTLTRPQTVGYGAAHRVAGPGRIATVPVGYADGYLRSASGRAFAAIGDTRVPLVGRVSMDLITLDVSTLPPGRAEIGTTVDLIGGPCPIDEVAGWAGSIANEFLTGLGARYARRYVGEET